MATEEMKPETKKNEQMQVKDLPPPPVPLPYKTCNLKVFIHCEGCKRKVKKILTNIEGVYRVDIDVKQNNVTVMGIASPEILLKRLQKAGKNADLLPEIPDSVENKPVDLKKKNIKKKEEKPEVTDKDTSSGTDKPKSEKPDVGGECSSVDGGETCGTVKEEKNEILKEKAFVPADSSSPSSVDSPAPAESPAPAAEKKAEESSGNVVKKKKKKGQNMNNVNNPTGGPDRGSRPPLTTTAAEDHDRPFNQHDVHQVMTNNNPPRPDMYHYPPNTYYAPQIMYGVSYNVAQPPVSVDAASYYSPAPPHSYAYMYPGYLPSDQNPYPSRPSDSFELFSDENPNGCSVM